MNLKPLAIAKPQESIEDIPSKIKQWWGQARHFLDKFSVGIILVMVLKWAGLDIDNDSFKLFIDLFDGFVGALSTTVAAAIQVVVHVSSWFANE